MASAMFYVYMLASKPYGTLYIGMTSDLARRIWEHKNKVVSGLHEEIRISSVRPASRIARRSEPPAESPGAM
jgi:predicted GIY-YIG superfamily endonuclease